MPITVDAAAAYWRSFPLNWPWPVVRLWPIKFGENVLLVLLLTLALKQETYNLSDLKHDLHCGFVELGGGSVSVSS